MAVTFGFWTLLRRQTLRERLRNAKGKAYANSASFGFWIMQLKILLKVLEL
jgi:hypothetical protein